MYDGGGPGGWPGIDETLTAPVGQGEQTRDVLSVLAFAARIHVLGESKLDYLDRHGYWDHPQGAANLRWSIAPARRQRRCGLGSTSRKRTWWPSRCTTPPASTRPPKTASPWRRRWSGRWATASSINAARRWRRTSPSTGTRRP